MDKQIVKSSLECRVDVCSLVEVVVGEEVDLVDEVPNVNTDERVHLREWKDAWVGDTVGVILPVRRRVP